LLTEELLSRLERLELADVSGLDTDVSVLAVSVASRQQQLLTQPPSSMSAISLPMLSVGFQMVVSSKPRKWTSSPLDPSP